MLMVTEYADWVRAALAEDRADHDVTSHGCIAPDRMATLDMVCRSDVCLAGGELAAFAFSLMDPAVEVAHLPADGVLIPAGGLVMRVTGRARALLGAERVALNILHVMGAIATHTMRMCAEISHTKTKLRDTRKTIPGLRALSKYAVRMGGGTNHRFSLGDAVLVKDNHIALHGGDIQSVIQSLRATTTLPIQIECDTLAQLEQALISGADQVLLDNMAPDMLRQAVVMTKGRIPLEASGGIGLHNIRAVAETGVDFVSAGCITQFTPAIDIGLDWGQGMCADPKSLNRVF